MTCFICDDEIKQIEKISNDIILNMGTHLKDDMGEICNVGFEEAK